MTAATQVERPTSPTPTPSRALRTDIEGLRALAIGLVLVYHAGIQFLPGGFIGVDVFFVVSGFLITGLLVREVERTGRVSLGRFYARRARRLLPAASLVLVVTAILTWLTSSVIDWQTFGLDIAAAAVYVINWRLADRSVDYLAEGVSASPVQHFWSLAVEEQFYIVWPLLLIVVAAVVRARRVPVRRSMGIGLSIIVVPSLIWSVIATANTPESAFFVTTTRLWELGIGAFVAVGAALWRHIPRAAALAIGWAGLATVVAGGFLLDGTVAWPSAWALVPTLGTAAVIVAGSAGAGVGLLSWKPFVWIGGLSYSLYLWHWPLLIAAQNVWGDLGQKKGLLVMLVSIIPAWLSLKLLENPVRHSKRLAKSNSLTLSLGLNLSVLGVVAGLVLGLATPTTGGASSSPADTSKLGANTLERTDEGTSGVEVVDQSPMSPSPTDAAQDVPSAYDKGCQADPEVTEPKFCEYGVEEGSRTVVLAGDSKALQWVDALDQVAKEKDWTLLVATKSACSFSQARLTTDGRDYAACREYSEKLLDDVLERQPDTIIVSQGSKTAEGPDGDRTTEAMVDALADTWQPLEDAGIDVVALLDNPSPNGLDDYDGQVYECVAENPTKLSNCAFGVQAGLDESGSPALEGAAKKVEGVDVVDLTDVLCNDTKCPAVVGEVLAYRQGSHLTNTFAMTTTGILEDEIAPLVEAAGTRPDEEN